MPMLLLEDWGKAGPPLSTPLRLVNASAAAAIPTRVVCEHKELTYKLYVNDY